MSKWGSRARHEHGAAVVETALCVCFIVLPLVFGVISYAYMLSFRQTVSQSAAEGARAAAVAPGASTLSQTDLEKVAFQAVDSTLAASPNNLKCGQGHMACTVSAATGCGNGSGGKCVTVTVTYPYRDHSLLPSIPGLGFTLPEYVTYSSSVQVS